MTDQPLLNYEVAPPEGRSKTPETLYSVNSETVFRNAQLWREQYQLRPARESEHQVTLVGIDWQPDFCFQDGTISLYPQTTSDIEKFIDFVYRNARVFTSFVFTLDSHKSYHIFSPIFWLDTEGNHPEPYTQVTLEDLLAKKYRVNPEMAYLILGSIEKLSWLEDYVIHYTRALAETNKQPLVIWPFHCEIGSAGNLLVPAIYEAIHYVSFARYCSLTFATKGNDALTEIYGFLAPEVLEAQDHSAVGKVRTEIITKLLESDILIISGEAKSHCVKIAVEQLLDALKSLDQKQKPLIYILSCTSSLPGFESQGDEAFSYFATQGIYIVNPETPIINWPEIPASFRNSLSNVNEG